MEVPCIHAWGHIHQGHRLRIFHLRARKSELGGNVNYRSRLPEWSHKNEKDWPPIHSREQSLQVILLNEIEILIFLPARAKRALWKWYGRFRGAKEKGLGFKPKPSCTVTLQQWQTQQTYNPNSDIQLKRHSPSLQTMHLMASHNSDPSACSLPSKMHMFFSISHLPHD